MADLPVTPLANYGEILSSLPTAQAGVNLTNAQTQGVQLANQQKQIQMSYYQKLLNSLNEPVNDQHASAGGAPPDTGGAAPADAGNGDLTLQSAGLDPAHVTQHATSQFAVRDTWTPQELMQLKLGMASGIPNAEQQIKALHDARIKTMTANAQVGASTAYDNAAAVAEAPDGTALETLSRIHPDAAAAIGRVAQQKGWTDDQVDQFTRMYSDEVGNAVHKYSGRDVEVGKDGIARDKLTNRPVLGGNPEGLSQKDWSDLATKANAIVTVTRNGRETQIPQWQADGATSAAQWVTQAAAKANGGAAGTAPGAAGPGTPSATTASAVAGLPKPVADFVTSGPKAPPFLNTGTGKPTPEETELQTQYGKDRASAYKEAAEDFTTAQKTLVSTARAAAALNSDKTTTLGPGSGTWSEVKTFFNNWTGRQAADAIENSSSMRQLLGKELGQDQLNTILAKLHGEGAQVRLGAQESSLILNALSANPDLSRNAISQMLTWERGDAQYDMQKAGARRAWVTAGNDVQQFDSLYEAKFPRSTNTQTALGAPGMQPPAPPPAASTAPAVQKFKALPAPGQYSGKTITERDSKGNVTGRFKSDGTKWIAVK